ncbi:MAG: MBL fold metallo-hydrolase, partial [Acaryochloridaceae cyanobacterium RL_2_7]|nr:MBL fold metallo-hydrolase [Acaryochloridaceae cyanobacterium RL_2_7]
LQSYRDIAPDFLIIESTLGNEKSPNRRYQEHQFMNHIAENIKNNQNIAIAASPLGQAQEIIMLLKNHPY